MSSPLFLLHHQILVHLSQLVIDHISSETAKVILNLLHGRDETAALVVKVGLNIVLKLVEVLILLH